MRVRVTRVDPSLPLPAYQSEGAVGFDLYARLETTIAAQHSARIPANLIVSVPDRFALLIFPRSSTAARYGLLMPNSAGVIDQDFRGPTDEIQLQVYNMRSDPITVPRGARLAQGIFMPIERAVWDEGTPVTSESRGGFGSTD